VAKKMEIDVVFDENGDMKADVVCGPGGAGCEKELDALLSTVGRKTAGNRKPEFFQKVQTGAFQSKKF